MFFGKIVHEANLSLKDISPREALPIVVLAGLAVWIGVYPAPFLERMIPSLELVLAKFQTANMTQIFLP
jgi:NADH-quinone oxidoreductase subunit M